MALQASGAISMGNINTELGLSATTQIGLNDSAVRTLLGKATGAIAMSDAYGKSNVRGFIAKYVSTGGGNAIGSMIGMDSSGSTYNFVFNGGSAVAQVPVLIKLTSTGGVTYKNTGYSTASVNNMFADPSFNIYIAGSRTGNARFAQIIKANSSGTVQYGKYWTQPASDFNNDGFRQVVDSSGNLYTVFRSVSQIGCCDYRYNFLLKKFDSSGTPSFARALPQSDNQQAYFPSGIVTDGTDFYVSWNNGVNVTSIIKFNAAGTILASGNFTTPNNNLSRSLAWDPVAGALYILWHNTDRAITKLNSSLVVQWTVTLPSLNSLDDSTCNPAFDSSGNIYIAGRCDNGSTNRAGIIKLNSSGTLQWARQISATLAGAATSIAVYGTNFAVAAYFYTGSAYNSYTFYAPTDGSATGTYTVGGTALTYASLSATNGTETVTKSGSLTWTTNSTISTFDATTAVEASALSITTVAI